MNPWHDVPLGENPAEIFQCVIEIEVGSKNKYELDKQTGLLRLDRVLYSAVHYPANYGFLPRTYCDDGDPLDVLVYMQEAVEPLTIVRARPIGVITMSDDKGGDDKIIAVCVDDPAVNHYTETAQFPPHLMRALQRFLMDYKTLEEKAVQIGPLRDRAAAQQVIREAMRLYQEKIMPNLARG